MKNKLKKMKGGATNGNNTKKQLEEDLDIYIDILKVKLKNKNFFNNIEKIKKTFPNVNSYTEYNQENRISYLNSFRDYLFSNTQNNLLDKSFNLDVWIMPLNKETIKLIDKAKTIIQRTKPKERRGAVSGLSGNYDCSTIKQEMKDLLITIVNKNIDSANQNIRVNPIPALIASIQQDEGYKTGVTQQITNNKKDKLTNLINELYSNLERDHPDMNLLQFILSFTFTDGNNLEFKKQKIIKELEKGLKTDEPFDKFFNDLIIYLLDNIEEPISNSYKTISLGSKNDFIKPINQGTYRGKIDWRNKQIRVLQEEIIKYMFNTLLDIFQRKSIPEKSQIIRDCFVKDKTLDNDLDVELAFYSKYSHTGKTAP